MNEHVSPETAKLRAPAKLIAFPGSPAARISARRAGRLWVIGGPLSALLIFVIAAIWWSVSGGDAVQYTTAQVTRGPVVRTVTSTGTVNPELTIIVGTYVSGVIQQLYCDYNTEVKKGQVCAKIDPRPYQSAVDQAAASLAIAKAQLEKDQANLDYAKVAFDRATRLVKTNAVSQDVLDNARSTYQQGQAQISFDQATIQQRQAALDAAQVNLDYTNIVSPVDGTVVSRSVTMGQTVAASFQTPTLFLIATDLTRMQVDTNTSEGDIGGINLGNEAAFSVDAFPNRVFHGKVSQIRQSPQIVQNVVTYDVVVTVDNSDLALKPGMTASARVTVDHRDDVLRVPNQALRYVPTGSEVGPSRVWILRNGRPTAVAVTPGLDDDNFTEIVSGNLAAGDRVITAEQTPTNKTVVPRLRF